MASSDTQFKPGQSGNPAGGPKDRVTQEHFRRVFEQVANTPATELKEMQGSSLQAVITKIMIRGMKTGEHGGLAWLLDRSLGKIPEVTLTAHVNEKEILGQPRERLYEFVKEAA